MKKRILLILLIAAALLAATGAALAADGFELAWWTVDGGGGTFNGGGSYTLGGTIGQPDAGTLLEGGSYTVSGGFWGGSEAEPVACHTLTVIENPDAGGNVARFPASDAACGDGQYSHGTDVTLTASPADGYRFVAWSGDVVSAAPSILVTMEADHSLTASFEAYAGACYTLSAAASPVGWGQALIETATNCSAGGVPGYTPGTVVTLRANPGSGYTLDGWTVDSAAGGAANPLSVTMNANHSVVANFLRALFLPLVRR